MASTAKAILAQVVTQIQAADGAGVYAYDLRAATGRVHRGAPRTMQIDATCEVWVRMVYERSVRGAPLTRYTRQLAVRVVAIASAFGDSAGDREDAVLDLTDTILRALEADRSLSGQVLDIGEASVEVMDGSRLSELGYLGVDEAESLAGVPVGVIEFVADYYMTTGV